MKTVKIIILSGRSGVGKTSVAYEIHEKLGHHSIPHVNLEADNLDEMFPEERESAELLLANLYSMWQNYTRLRGCTNLLMNGTALVLEHENIKKTVQMAARTPDNPDVQVETRVFVLSSSDETAHGRLSKREIGSTLQRHLESSTRMSKELNSLKHEWIEVVDTNDKSVLEIADSIVERCHRWLISDDAE